jgi:hypothetical protein
VLCNNIEIRDRQFKRSSCCNIGRGLQYKNSRLSAIELACEESYESRIIAIEVELRNNVQR